MMKPSTSSTSSHVQQPNHSASKLLHEAIKQIQQMPSTSHQQLFHGFVRHSLSNDTPSPSSSDGSTTTRTTATASAASSYPSSASASPMSTHCDLLSSPMQQLSDSMLDSAAASPYASYLQESIMDQVEPSLDDETFLKLSEYLTHQHDDRLHHHYQRPSVMSPQTFKAETTMSNGFRIAVVGVPSKSRVETQIKLCIQLLTDKGDKVSSWPYLKLPDHLLARSRLRRQQKSASPMSTDLPAEQDDQTIIHLDARVACASRPNDPVKMCIGCIQRERKRAERSKNAHLSDLPDKAFPEEDRVLLFNCGPIVNFDSGDAVLPTRITCYCRHHGERDGFCIHFTLRDSNGELVASGVSPPILITDDHKSSYRKTSISSNATTAKAIKNAATSTGRKRSRAEMISEDEKCFPNDSIDSAFCTSPHSLCSLPTPSASRRGSQEQQPTGTGTSTSTSSGKEDAEGAPKHSARSSSSASRGDGTATTISIPSSSTSLLPQSHPSAPLLPTPDQEYADLQSFFSPAVFSSDHRQQQQQPPPAQTQAMHCDTAIQRPVLERLVPAQGPTYGGIEVTVLGSGFTRETTCLFGEHEATTVFWNPNTLVCVLPAVSQPAPVVVSFKQQPILLGPSQGVPLFTYYDANDHALLELALQVVGLKMTGKLQDAKQIAMRIVQGDDIWMRHSHLARHQPQHLSIPPSSTPSSPTSFLPDHS